MDREEGSFAREKVFWGQIVRETGIRVSYPPLLLLLLLLSSTVSTLLLFVFSRPICDIRPAYNAAPSLS